MMLTSTIVASLITVNTPSQKPSIINNNKISLARNFITKDNNYSQNLSIINDNKRFDFKYEKEYSKIYEELESYKNLKENWDGYQGIKPTDELINTTKEFLAILKSKEIINPNIMVSGLGEIALFWENNDKYIEVDFDLENYFSFFYKIDTKIYGEDDVKVNSNLSEKLFEILVYFKKSINTDTTDYNLVA